MRTGRADAFHLDALPGEAIERHSVALQGRVHRRGLQLLAGEAARELDEIDAGEVGYAAVLSTAVPVRSPVSVDHPSWMTPS